MGTIRTRILKAQGTASSLAARQVAMGTIRTRILKVAATSADKLFPLRRNGHAPHEDTESLPDSIARLPSRCRNGHAPHEDTESFAADAAATLLLGSQWARSARGY